MIILCGGDGDDAMDFVGLVSRPRVVAVVILLKTRGDLLAALAEASAEGSLSCRE
jgi:hypothetical protein